MRWHEHNGKYEARIFNGEKQLSLGYYQTQEAAARAYDEAAKQLRGVHAVTNFPSLPAEAISAAGAPVHRQPTPKRSSGAACSFDWLHRPSIHPATAAA